MIAARTIAGILRAGAEAYPDRPAFHYLSSGDGEPLALTYGELDRRARAVASAASKAAGGTGGIGPETTILLAYPAGPDFAACFFGCLYARAIAVPVRYPNPRRPLGHLASVAADSGSAVVLTTAEMRGALADLVRPAIVLAPDDIAAAGEPGWSGPEPGPDDVSHLQYTSGSTAAPKGVILRHRHVIANSVDIARAWRIGPESRILSWLPHYHDLGLIFGCIQPLFTGCEGFLMNPAAFARSPLAWLEAITRHRITHTAAPNFAFQACLEIPEERRRGLDLSSLECATNGAEPVRADTVRDFAEAFGPFGFRPEAMCPGYGLAESTLMATLCGPDRAPAIADFRARALAAGALEPAGPGEAGRTLVASSGGGTDTRVIVVDPEARVERGPGEVGEIWLAGPAVADGYWRRPAESAERFGARLAGDGSGERFLRTGDLGALAGGELFVLGRIDDTIIVRGLNHRPEDIELTVELSHPALEPGGGAAFAVEMEGEARLVVAQEVRREALRGLDGEALVQSIRRAVSEAHELEVAAVALLQPRGLPKTHTGKKQRRNCRAEFEQGKLAAVMTWRSPRLRPEPAPAAGGEAVAAGRVEALVGWLRDYSAERLNSRLMDERRSIPPHVVMDLGNRGLLGMVAPEAYGGLGLSNSELVSVVQQLAAIDTTLASFVLVNNALGIRPILRHATPETRDSLMPRLATGRELASFAMTEADAGSNIRNLSAIGRPDGSGGWTLWGTKLWSGSASWAGVINTFVQLEGSTAGAPRGVTGFVLRQGSPGLRNGPEALTMGLRAMVQTEVRLEGVRVTEADRLGAIGDGMTAAGDTMAFGRFAIGAMSLGIIKRCVQLMVRHGGRRSIATGRLLDNPATLMRISDLAAAATAVEALIGTVAERLDRGSEVPPELYCLCKTAGPEFAWRAADGLVQQLAGRGFIETNLAPQILRDTRVLRIFEGPTEPMNAHSGSRLVHLPEALGRFVGEVLGEPELAREMIADAQRVWERCLSRADRLGGAQAAKQWAYVQIGEASGYALLLACLRHRADSVPAEERARAETWCRLRYQRRLAKALGAIPAETALLDARQAEALATGYAGTIGDVEQTLAGEGGGLDPILTRSGDRASPGPESAPPPIVAVEASSGAEGPVLDWLKSWLAAEYGQDESRISGLDRFADFGMDSIAATLMVGALEARFNVELSPTLAWEYPTLGAMAAHVAEAAAAGGGAKTGDLSVLAGLDSLSEDELEALVELYSHDAPAAE
ncbi:MAG TPA: AMP-binding protein [Allosphingosinicella sp.]|jgi:acyl-CoA synthetase (AMP-forming)/AMP-acid ligase II/alkylation response protein AidB-like acyl-CoA dehydrogenase/acyl carrier protein